MSVSRLATAALNYLLRGWRNGTVLAATGATNTEPSSTQVTIHHFTSLPFLCSMCPFIQQSRDAPTQMVKRRAQDESAHTAQDAIMC